MNSCFILEESSWAKIDPNDEESHSALDELIILLDTLREKELSVIRHTDFYFTELKNGDEIYSILYEGKGCIERDKVFALTLAFERAECAEEDKFPLLGYDAVVNGNALMSPAICLAHEASIRGRCVSPIAFRSNEENVNACEVLVEDNLQEIFFTKLEDDIKKFFRFVIVKNGYDEDKIEEYSFYAFPTLGWANDVWLGLKANSNIFLGNNGHILLLHLSVLDDEGADIFLNCVGGDGASERFGALGVIASTENGNARGCNESRRSRTRKYNEQDCVFWWHTKIFWDTGRIHFKYFPSPNGLGTGHIAIGLFTNHAYLPGR